MLNHWCVEKKGDVMARSYRQTPIAGETRASDKAAKVRWHRQVRHWNRLAVQQGRECLPVRARAQVLRGAKHGKHWFDPTDDPQGMRK